MARSGEFDRAVVALETALRFRPDMVNAHRYLATIHRNNGKDSAKALFHRKEAQRIVRGRPRVKQLTSDRIEKLFDLPKIPSREERLKILLRERPDPKREEPKSGKSFVLVSGLPRSGTSAMMQLLEAGGMSVMTDQPYSRAASLSSRAVGTRPPGSEMPSWRCAFFQPMRSIMAW